MIPEITEFKHYLEEMASFLDKEEDPPPQSYALFFRHPELAFKIIDELDAIIEPTSSDYPSLYSASIFALDICVAQLQAATDSKNKIIGKVLTQIMSHFAQIINKHNHSLGYWLPVLNAFYEVQAELTEDLKMAFLELANLEDGTVFEANEQSHLNSIKELIQELSDLSAFDIMEHFFAQSYAMPPEFMGDLVIDLYNIEEGKDLALLALMHPNAEVREVVVETLEELMNQITLSSLSLSRLETIKHWYPKAYHPTFNNWIKIQRIKGVVFEPEPKPAEISIKATEVDGSGSQGIFIHFRKNRKNRLAGVLLKQEVGLKDAWITHEITKAEVDEYYNQSFEESITLREVDLDYLVMMVEHYLAILVEQGNIINLHFLEIQELAGVRFKPKKMDIDAIFEELSIPISPFTEETIQSSFKRSKSWLTSKRFTESWYMESPLIDKIVNHNSSFIQGIKVCRIDKAMEEVFAEELEKDRGAWMFHFLWVALWFKTKARKNEKTWSDSFLIAYSIREGTPLKDIPVMEEICRQTVINSVETMQERKTYLSKE